MGDLRKMGNVTDNILSDSDGSVSVTFDGWNYITNCRVCNKKIKTSYPHQRYCSNSCSYEGERIRHKKNNKKRVECICLVCCEKHFAKRKDAKFCSVKCRVANFRLPRIHKNNDAGVVKNTDAHFTTLGLECESCAQATPNFKGG